jgi:hypothetical protein
LIHLSHHPFDGPVTSGHPPDSLHTNNPAIQQPLVAGLPSRSVQTSGPTEPPFRPSRAHSVSHVLGLTVHQCCRIRQRGFIDDDDERLGTETARLKNQTRGRERGCARDGTVGVAMNTAVSPYKPLF